MTATLVHEGLSVNATEQHASAEAVYGDVMELAWQVSPFNPDVSVLRGDIYVDVQPVALARMAADVRGHRLFDSNQTVLPTGSYKLRGGMSAVSIALHTHKNLTDLHVASAGNAANGVNRARRVLGARYGRSIGLTVECTEGASYAKTDPLEADGVTVNRRHKKFKYARRAVKRSGERPGHVAVDAYDAVETIVGQSTIGWETLEDLRQQAERGEVDLHATPVKLFVPVGGGGLITGIACVMRWAKDNGLVGENVQVIGVQMEGCDAMKRYRDYVLAGLTPPAGLFAEGVQFSAKADGTAVEEPGELTRAVACDPRFVADIVTVSEGELGLAMADATRCHGRRIEPAGALSLAGASLYAQMYPRQPRTNPPRTLITFTTGANVADELYEYFTAAAQTERDARKARARAELEHYRNHTLGEAALVSPRPSVRGKGYPQGVAPSKPVGRRGNLSVWNSPV